VTWAFAIIGLVLIVVIGLVVLGRETARLAAVARPAVLDLNRAVEHIADHLPADVQARLSHDDVRWILLADADLLESRSVEAPLGETDPDALVIDEDDAVARLLEAADASGRDLADEDIVAVLDGRSAYLDAIGAVGPQVDDQVEPG
jgi:hypothetical protein